jgi:hypothetical protein
MSRFKEIYEIPRFGRHRMEQILAEVSENPTPTMVEPFQPIVSQLILIGSHVKQDRVVAALNRILFDKSGKR